MTVLEFLARHAGMIGLIFFFSFFSVMAVWIYRPASKNNYQKNADIPLQETMHE